MYSAVEWENKRFLLTKFVYLNLELALTFSFFLPLPSRTISHARGHLRVSRFARRTTEKRQTARSLISWEEEIFTAATLVCT